MSLIPFEQRVRPYQTIYNFRDFGGYAAGEGQRVVTDRLFRSAHLANLSDEELSDIASLGIDLVVDMRHAPERAKQPSKWSPDTVLTLPKDHAREAAKVAPHEAFTREEMYSASDARRYMMGSYVGRPHDAGFVSIHRDTLMAMTEEGAEAGRGSGPNVLVHCAAGKDRTGTMCALVLGLLGVSDDDIMADYLLTRDAVDIEAILAPAATMFSARHGRDYTPDMLRPMFGVDPDYLEASLDAMGPFDGYARDTLGLSDERLERLRARYREPAA